MKLNDILRIDLNKNAKFPYYIKNIFRTFIPVSIYQKRIENLFKNREFLKDKEYINFRVNYYNKLNNNFLLDDKSHTIKEFRKQERKKTYYFDLLQYLLYFNKNLKISYIFGDTIDIPKVPSLLKSRPISDKNKNAILMNLNKIRHFIFVNDRVKFQDKKDLLVWRGKAHQPHRKYFLEKFYENPLCDVGQIIKNSDKNPRQVQWVKEKLSLKKQLEYKFILAIEGNDVASNLKWVMSSNSIAFMVKPKFETWFMEGRLIPNYHYVLIKDDYSDLEEKIKYYSYHTKKALEIIDNAHEYIKQFKNKEREDLISLLVLEKYFELSGQIHVPLSLY